MIIIIALRKHILGIIGILGITYITCIIFFILYVYTEESYNTVAYILLTKK